MASVDPLAALADTHPDAHAITDGATVTTWADLNVAVNRLANGLAGLGVRAGQRVAWCGPNSTDVVVAMHACRKVGAVEVPVPYRLTPGECRYILSDSGATVVLVDAGYRPTVDAALPPGCRSLTFGEVSGPDNEPLVVPEAGRAMLYTSGTTGRPKGAIRGPADPALRGAMMAALDFGIRSEVHLVTGPLYHAGPHAFALLAHLSGGSLVVTPTFDPTEWARLAGKHRVTSAFVAPIHLKRILALPDDVLAAADLSSLRSVIVNAAPVPYALKQEVLARLGDGFLYEVYGSTELGIVTVLPPEDQLARPGSCGRPYGGIGLRIVGHDGAALRAGEEGEVFVRTPQAFEGYHGAVDALVGLPGDERWQSVGDIGWVDHDGYLHICDRRTDMVITGGVNVYPAEVEAALYAHPDVGDAAVIGVPDNEWGERVHAVVVARPGRRLDASTIDDFLVGRLAGFKRPRSMEFRDGLPRTESGKLLKRVLRAEVGGR